MCIAHAGQDPVGVRVQQDKPNKHNSTVSRVIALLQWSRTCFSDKAHNPPALISKANHWEAHQYWEQMQQSGQGLLCSQSARDRKPAQTDAEYGMYLISVSSVVSSSLGCECVGGGAGKWGQ